MSEQVDNMTAMNRSRTLHINRLIENDACGEQVELFRSTFGDSVDVTAELAVEMAGKFDITWAAENLLSASAWAEYDRVMAPALTEYYRVMASARAEYDKVTAFAWAEYDKVKVSARAEYDKVAAFALAEYDNVMASAWPEHEKVMATAFATCYAEDSACG